MNNVLLISENTIKNLSLLQLNVDSKILSRTILDVQFISLRPILGDTLYKEVLEDVSNKVADSSYTMKYVELLESYIQPYLSHAVVQDWIMNSTYKLTNKGVLKYNDTQAVPLSPDEVEYARDYHSNKVAAYKKALICYLGDNDLVNCGTDKGFTENAIGWVLF